MPSGDRFSHSSFTLLKRLSATPASSSLKCARIFAQLCRNCWTSAFAETSCLLLAAADWTCRPNHRANRSCCVDGPSRHPRPSNGERRTGLSGDTAVQKLASAMTASRFHRDEVEADGIRPRPIFRPIVEVAGVPLTDLSESRLLQETRQVLPVEDREVEVSLVILAAHQLSLNSQGVATSLHERIYQLIKIRHRQANNAARFQEIEPSAQYSLLVAMRNMLEYVTCINRVRNISCEL